MFNFQIFEEVFPADTDCYYDANLCQEIGSNKKKMQGLFIEKVMKDIGIKRPQKLYPPKDNNTMRNLHKEVIKSNAPEQHKISILYYILLHLDEPTGNRNQSLKFASSTYMPQMYQITMNGFWHMDEMEFQEAIEYLTHPSLIPTYCEDILEILVRNVKDDHSLALAYYYTIQPALTNKSAIECLFTAIAGSSVSEAFFFSRGQAPNTHRHTFEMLISLVIHNSPAETIADRGVELVNLPMSMEEEEWFEDYLLHGDGTRLKKAKDTVLFRRMATGKFTESLAVKPSNTRSISGLDWSSLARGVENGLGPRLEK